MKEKIRYCYYKQLGKFLDLIRHFVENHFFFPFSYLMKSWSQAIAGDSLVPTMEYLRDSIKKRSNIWDSSITGIIKALQLVAAK